MIMVFRKCLNSLFFAVHSSTHTLLNFFMTCGKKKKKSSLVSRITVCSNREEERPLGGPSVEPPSFVHSGIPNPHHHINTFQLAQANSSSPKEARTLIFISVSCVPCQAELIFVCQALLLYVHLGFSAFSDLRDPSFFGPLVSGFPLGGVLIQKLYCRLFASF